MVTLRGVIKGSCYIMFSVICLAGAAVFSLIVGVTGGPWHASCSIDWTFGKKCSFVNNALVDQIRLWETADNCKDGGEKCLYKLVSRSESKIEATHTTPVKHYVDDLTFDFKQNADAVCKVNGFSTSETWYAVLDYGTNYCNLHNLITGAGLDKDDPKYTENTNDSICTQYSKADCEVY